MPKEMKRNKVPPSNVIAQEDFAERITAANDQPVKSILLSYIERLPDNKRLSFWKELEERGFIK